jgi:DNA replication and repair protein RecF
MIVTSLLLENFRNYKKKEFEFNFGVNLVVGPNTSGKTTLLEAVFLLASGTSPRASLDRELVRQGSEFAFARGKIDGSEELEVQLIASKNSPTVASKRYKVNGVGKRLGDFLSEFHAVLFAPEDLSLVTDSPDLRRRFLDLALSGVGTRYRRALTEYDKVRKRRNRLLEGINEGHKSEGELGFWDAKLLEFGTFIQDERKKFFNEVNSLLATRYFSLNYLTSGLTAERLQEFRPREIAAETTLIGPHRDDFEFLAISNKPLASSQRNLSAYGSRSEQRRAVLALKRAELEFVERKIGDQPVLLLDDIFSELDRENRDRVAKELIGGGQAIITTAEIDHIPENLQEKAQIIEL